MSVAATANQPTASSGTITFSWTTTNATSTTASLQYATIVSGPFTTLTSTTLTDVLNGTRTGVYTTPTTSYYYQTTVTAQGTGGPVTSTSSALYYYNPYQGPQGVQGSQGPQGIQGNQGVKGEQGLTGLQGVVAINGLSAINQLLTTTSTVATVNANSGLTWNGSTLNVSGNVAATSINNGSSTFTVTSTTGTNSNTLTVGPGNGTGYAISTSGTILASDVTASSDRRMKSDIATISNALDTVKAMRGVYFTRLGQSNRSVGVIAQEVEEVLPEVVHTGSDDMKSVSYGNIVGLLIEAVKELAEKMKV